ETRIDSGTVTKTSSTFGPLAAAVSSRVQRTQGCSPPYSNVLAGHYTAPSLRKIRNDQFRCLYISRSSPLHKPFCRFPRAGTMSKQRHSSTNSAQRAIKNSLNFLDNFQFHQRRSPSSTRLGVAGLRRDQNNRSL